MKLMSIQNNVQRISASVSKIMGADVIVVDDELQRVADTFQYPISQIAIHSRSIIGSVVRSGTPKIIDNKDYFQFCLDCSARSQCKMQGFIGVPIISQGSTIGAIGMVVEKHNLKHLVWNIDQILTFLQQIAELLSEKLVAQDARAEIGHMSFQLEHMLAIADSGIALVDENNVIVTHNEQFCRSLRRPGKSLKNQRMTDLLTHPVIETAIETRQDLDKQTLVSPLPDGCFYGQVCVRHLWRDGVYCGAVYSLQDKYGAHSNKFLLYNGDAFSTTAEVNGKETKNEATRGGQYRSFTQNKPLFLCGPDEKRLFRLAVGIHNSTRREGRFMVIDSEDLFDGRLVWEQFSIPEVVPEPLFLAQRGTVCFQDVFGLPGYVQRWILARLRAYEPEEEPAQSDFDAAFVFLAKSPLPKPDQLFLEPGFLTTMLSYRLNVPKPQNKTQMSDAALNRCLSKCAACYKKTEVVIEPEARKQLESFPWETDGYSLNRVIDYLVRTCDVISKENVDFVISQLEKVGQSLRHLEQKEILSLLDAGFSIDHISARLQISRSTLYRRIKMYQTK